MSDRITGKMKAMPTDPQRRRQETLYLFATVMGLGVFIELCVIAYGLGQIIGNHL
jgi:hypothetical protein